MASTRLFVSNEVLPTHFRNVILANSDQNTVIIRSNLTCMSQINEWVATFGELTNTKWNSRDSRPSGQRIVCSKKYVCHHSGFQKVPRDKNKNGISKNADCHAGIFAKVKLDTCRTREVDDFVRQGLLAVITINTQHSHTLNTAETLRFLPAATSVTREIFLEYFNDGLGIAESAKYHQGVMEIGCEYREEDFANNRINPTSRVIRHWYDQWRLLNLGPRSGPDMIEKKQADGRTKNRKVLCETPNEPDTINTRNEQDTKSSDSNNKEDTENSLDEDRLKKQEGAASSSIPTDDSSACLSNAKPEYVLKEKMRSVNVAFFVKSLKDLNSHGGDGCTFSDMNISGETKNGWNAGIKLSCSVCLTTVIVWMDDPAAKLGNSQPPAPSTSAGTATDNQLTAEEIPTKKRRINNKDNPVQPVDPLVQLQTMVPPADPLVQLQSMVPPILARPLRPQSNPSPNQSWRHNPLHSIHSQAVVPPTLARPSLGLQINSPNQNRTLNPLHSGNPNFMVPPQLARPLVQQSNSPHQGWRPNSLHSINQFLMQPQITRPFVPQSDSSPHQYWTYNPPHSGNPHFMVPPPSARPFLMPQSNTVYQDGTDNPSHSMNLHSTNQTSFVKQELVSPEDAACSSITRVATSSNQPACMQLLFCVEPSENANSTPRSANEGTTLTPDETLTNCQTSSTTGLESRQNFSSSENEILVPEIMPAEVLPVDLNLVKEEIEDEYQNMEFSVRLVPHSEVSLNHSETPFASDSSIKAKTVTDSLLVNIESVMPSTIETTESGAKLFAPVSDSLGAKDSTVSSYPTSPQTVFQQVISCSKEDVLRQTANGESDNILNINDKTNVTM